jgi:hypothetical protein
MDSARFDDLTRLLTRPLRRRGLVTGAAAALAGLLARPRPVAAECETDESCGINLKCCGGVCYNPDLNWCADEINQIVCALGQELCEGEFNTTCCQAICCGGNCCFGDVFCLEETGQCCEAGYEVCANGHCIHPNATDCGPNASFDFQECRCQHCQAGQVPCQGHCVLPCAADHVLNVETCACDCLTACGDLCCSAGEICCSDGKEGGAGTCCPGGQCCGAACKGDDEVLCCHDAKRDTDFACVDQIHTCCPRGRRGGPSCCLKRSQRCDQGVCVKKKKRKKRT